MGPVGGRGVPQGISMPGGIGGPGQAGRISGAGAGGLTGLQHTPSGMAGVQHPSGGIAGPQHPSGGTVPQNFAGSAGLRSPSGIGGQGRPGGVGTAGGIREPGSSSGFGGLGSLARSGAPKGHSSTPHVNQHALAEHGNHVRNSYHHDGCFRDNWWYRHHGAWRAERWAAAAAAYYYATASWAAYYSYCGYAYSSQPIYYNYGSYVVYENTNVYINGQAVATQQQYAEQAVTIADTGKQAQVSQDEEWLSLGVFSLVQTEQSTSNDLFQLAVNKSGVLRGNYYNTLTDTTLPVYGSVDKKNQRAAWTVGDRKEPVFEAGMANLTTSETTMLAHFGKDRTEQWTLVRINPSETKQEHTSAEPADEHDLASGR